MKLITPEIAWHGREPVYSVDFQPGDRRVKRVASGGQDKIVRVWQFTLDAEGKGSVEFLSNLRRHTATVNVVRFSKSGDLLATAGDDNVIILWKLSDVSAPANSIFAGDDDVGDDKETWVCHKTLRGHLGDVSDLSWSKNDRCLVSGSVDNTAIVWDIKKDTKLAMFTEHKSYVQGVTFDPLGDLVATLCSDRSLRLYNIHTSKSILHTVSKMAPLQNAAPQKTDAPTTPDPKSSDSKTPDPKPKPFKMFHDDSLRSFFRRLDFSPDGQLLVVPAGCVEQGDGKLSNASFVFSRSCLTKPALYLPCGDKATTVVRVNPQLFTLRPAQAEEVQAKDEENKEESEDKKEWEKNKSLFCLPYRMVFAVASEDTVLIYDTQQTIPVGLLRNIHYHQISDLSWSSDGRVLIVSSTDGFCTIATFEKGELGDIYIKPQRVSERQAKQEETKKEGLKSDSESPLPFGQYLKESGGEKTLATTSEDSVVTPLKQDAPKASGSSETKQEKSNCVDLSKEEGKSEQKEVKQTEMDDKVQSLAIKDNNKADVTQADDKKTDNKITEAPQKKRISFTTLSLNKK